MSILAMSYFSSTTYSDDEDHVLWDAVSPPVWNNGDNRFGIPGAQAFYIPPAPHPANKPEAFYETSYKLPDTLPEELWFRYVWRTDMTPDRTGWNSRNIFRLGITHPTTHKFLPTVTLSHNGSGLTIQVTHYDQNFVATNYPAEHITDLKNCIDVTTKNLVVNFRLKLSNTAGFVQVYNHQNRLSGEFLGRTSPDDTVQAKPTYGTIGHGSPTDWGYSSSFPLFGVVADEKTFGLWLAPLVAKREGGYQDQDTGSAYTSFTAFKTIPSEGTHLTMTVAQNQNKHYTYKTTDFSDINVPANYEIKAVRMAATFETESSDGIAVPYNMIIKTGGDPAQDHLYPCAEIVPNTNNTQDGRWQVRSSPILENNPSTNAAWTRDDIAALEIGFAVTGV